MSNIDIALSFDTAEYYSLQEACDYLNRKHKTHNITPKKLLKKISTRNIDTFIHFRMDNLSNKPLRVQTGSYNSNIFSVDISVYNLSEEELRSTVDLIHRIEEFVSNKLIDDLYMGLFLFKVDEQTLSNMALSSNPNGETILFGFKGFIQIPYYDDDPSKPRQLKEWELCVEEKNYYLTEIGYFNFVIDSIDDKDLADFAKKVPFSCSFDKRKDFTFPSFKIKQSDLIILHKDLLCFEREVLNNEHIEVKSKLEARKGISQKKLLAKALAKHIAVECWHQDTENKIKIGEMCEIVWSKLIDAGFDTEPPNHTIVDIL